MIARLVRVWRRRRGSCNAGSAAVEFAITAPILIVLALGVADYGALMTNWASLQGATRAAAEYARNSPACAAGGLANSVCITGLTNLYTVMKSNDTSLSSATFAPSAALTTAANYCTCTDGSEVSCSSGTCNVGGDPRVVQYIQITATQSVNPLLAPLPFGFPSSLSGQTTTRIN